MTKDKVNFTIRDGTYLDYDSAKQDYLDGVRGKSLQEKYDMSTSSYKKFLRDLREEGITTPRRGGYNKLIAPRYYTKVVTHGSTYYVVKRTIKGVQYYGGYFKTEAEAIARVRELDEIGWESCL